MATLQPFPKFRAFDLDGNPLSGGFVYTYAAGTSTPLVTYTDSSGDPASENTNPVELDAAGEANIWYGDSLYKLALFNADNVLQWTIDNIGSGTSSSIYNGGFGSATDIASASIVDLGTVTSHFANITGTTTITGFGSSALITAPVYLVKFEGALTLTQGANLFLPNSANITTAQNDRALVEYLGSGSWRVFSYMRADGSPIILIANTVQGVGTDAGYLAFREGSAGGTNTVKVQAPTVLASDVTFTLPLASGVPALTRKFTATVYTSGSGNWTSPDDITSDTVFKITGTGGGAGGSTGSTINGGGGAGGTFIKYVTGLTASTNYAYAVGAGGNGGSTPSNGGNTTFNDGSTTYTANGGEIGAVGGVAGLGGTATNGSLNIIGGDGSSSNPNSNPAGTGGASYWGGGGKGTESSSTGSNGRSYGSGGGGGSNNNSGKGAGGVLVIERLG